MSHPTNPAIRGLLVFSPRIGRQTPRLYSTPWALSGDSLATPKLDSLLTPLQRFGDNNEYNLLQAKLPKPHSERE